MKRVKIHPPRQFLFHTTIPVRITDVNYGGHVGNDSILSFIHEARIRFLQSHGFNEMQFAGVGLIMRDAAIEYLNELFYGDLIDISVACSDFSSVSFDVHYKFEKTVNHKVLLAVLAKTGMVCYDYQRKKVVAVPDGARLKLAAE